MTAAGVDWLDEVLAAVHRALLELAAGRLLNPPRREFLGGQDDPDYFRLEMPATLSDAAGQPLLSAVKIIEEQGARDELGARQLGPRTARLHLRHLPSGQEVVLDADALTDWRTGAAAAQAARYLLPAVESVLVVGTGRVARATVLALDRLLAPARITATSRQATRREAFAAALVGSIQASLCTIAPEAAPRDAELIVSAVPAAAPVLTARMDGARLLVVVEGDPRSCQVAPDLLAERTLVVDDLAQALATGSCRSEAVRARLTGGKAVLLADLAAGRRLAAEARPLVMLTGLAALDLMVGARLWRRQGGPVELP